MKTAFFLFLACVVMVAYSQVNESTPEQTQCLQNSNNTLLECERMISMVCQVIVVFQPYSILSDPIDKTLCN